MFLYFLFNVLNVNFIYNFIIKNSNYLIYKLKFLERIVLTFISYLKFSWEGKFACPLIDRSVDDFKANL